MYVSICTLVKCTAFGNNLTLNNKAFFPCHPPSTQLVNKRIKAYLENNDDLSKIICFLFISSWILPISTFCHHSLAYSPKLEAEDLLSWKSSKPVAWVISHYYGNQFGASVWIPILKCNYAKMCTYVSDLLKRNLFPFGWKTFLMLNERRGKSCFYYLLG